MCVCVGGGVAWRFGDIGTKTNKYPDKTTEVAKNETDSKKPVRLKRGVGVGWGGASSKVTVEL